MLDAWVITCLGGIGVFSLLAFLAYTSQGPDFDVIRSAHYRADEARKS